jgi:hypothetical protein
MDERECLDCRQRVTHETTCPILARRRAIAAGRGARWRRPPTPDEAARLKSALEPGEWVQWIDLVETPEGWAACGVSNIEGRQP